VGAKVTGSVRLSFGAGGMHDDAVDDDGDAAGVHQLHAAGHGRADGGRCGVDAGGGAGAENGPIDGGPQRDADLLAAEQLLHLQRQLTDVGAHRGRLEVHRQATFGAAGQAQDVGMDGEGVARQPQTNFELVAARVAQAKRVDHADAGARDAEVEGVGRDLERLSFAGG
jgi:hypothetical protein